MSRRSRRQRTSHLFSRDLEALTARLLNPARFPAADEVEDAARTIFRRMPPLATPEATVGQYANVCFEIERVNELTSPGQRDVRVLNGLFLALAQAYSTRLPLDPSVATHISRLQDDLAQRYGPGVFDSKMIALDLASRNRLQLSVWARESFADVANAGDRGLDAALTSAAPAVAQAMHELGRYGVKPAVFRDGLHHAPQDSWILLDGYEQTENISEHVLADASPAQVFLSAGPVRSLAARMDGDEATGVTLHHDFSRQFSMTIRRDGGLDCGPVFGLSPLKDVFAAVGVEAAYPAFQMIQLMRLYDLVMPIEKVRELPAWPALPQTGAVFGEQAAESARLAPTDLRRLVIPRLRLLEGDFPLGELLEREVEEGMRASRAPAERHPVAGHKRDLPPGRQATEEARRLALKEAGYELKPGETWVRRHDRGVGELGPVGHRATRRAAVPVPNLRSPVPRSGEGPTAGGAVRS